MAYKRPTAKDRDEWLKEKHALKAIIRKNEGAIKELIKEKRDLKRMNIAETNTLKDEMLNLRDEIQKAIIITMPELGICEIVKECPGFPSGMHYRMIDRGGCEWHKRPDQVEIIDSTPIQKESCQDGLHQAEFELT